MKSVPALKNAGNLWLSVFAQVSRAVKKCTEHRRLESKLHRFAFQMQPGSRSGNTVLCYLRSVTSGLWLATGAVLVVVLSSWQVNGITVCEPSSCPMPLTPSTRWVNPYEAPGDRTWRLYSVPSVEQANVPCSSALNVMLSPRVTAEVATWFQPKAQTDFILSVHWFWCWQDSEQRWVPFFQCFFGLLFQAFKFCLNPWK